jgi:hypothetical protein
MLDAVTRERFAEFIGRDADPTGEGKDVIHLKSLMGDVSHYRFEWHPQKRKVYLVRRGRDPEIGEILAEHANTHGEAINFVQTFLRGYREGQAPGVKPHLIG